MLSSRSDKSGEQEWGAWRPGRLRKNVSINPEFIVGKSVCSETIFTCDMQNSVSYVMLFKEEEAAEQASKIVIIGGVGFEAVDNRRAELSE